MPLYFAYGANMDRAAMRERCPQSTMIGPARLARHRFFIMREGYASVTRDQRHDVWGLLWDLAFADIPALDCYEGVASGLYAKISQSILTPKGARRALVYVGRRSVPGPARPGYMEMVVAAADEAGLPDAYRRDLRAHLTGFPISRVAAPPVARVGPLWASPADRDDPS